MKVEIVYSDGTEEKYYVDDCGITDAYNSN